MTFWTIVLVIVIGGIISGIINLLLVLLGYWLRDLQIKRKKKRGIV